MILILWLWHEPAYLHIMCLKFKLCTERESLVHYFYFFVSKLGINNTYGRDVIKALLIDCSANPNPKLYFLKCKPASQPASFFHARNIASLSSVLRFGAILSSQKRGNQESTCGLPVFLYI